MTISQAHLLFADAGIPMIVLTFPFMLTLLIPVIVIEGYLCKRWLGLSTWTAMKSNALSNLASTVFGVPLAWAIMLGVEMIVGGTIGQFNLAHTWNSPLARVIWLLLGSAWIGPPGKNTTWVVPAATLVLLVPFFFASYAVEYRVMKSMLGMPEGGPPNLAYPRIRIAIRNANLITYGVLFAGTAVWLVLSLPRHR